MPNLPRSFLIWEEEKESKNHVKMPQKIKSVLKSVLFLLRAHKSKSPQNAAVTAFVGFCYMVETKRIERLAIFWTGKYSCEKASKILVFSRFYFNISVLLVIRCGEMCVKKCVIFRAKAVQIPHPESERFPSARRLARVRIHQKYPST